MHRNLKLPGLCYRTYTCMYTCVGILINYSKPKLSYKLENNLLQFLQLAITDMCPCVQQTVSSHS